MLAWITAISSSCSDVARVRRAQSEEYETPKKKKRKRNEARCAPTTNPHTHTHTHTLTHQHTPTHTHTARAGPTSYANEATTAETATCPSRNAVRRPSPLSLPGFTALGRVFAKLLPPVFHWRRFNRGRNALEAPSSS